MWLQGISIVIFPFPFLFFLFFFFFSLVRETWLDVNYCTGVFGKFVS